MNPRSIPSSRPSISPALGNLPGSNRGRRASWARAALLSGHIRLWIPNVAPAEVQQWNLTANINFRQQRDQRGLRRPARQHLIAAMPFFQKQLVSRQTPLPVHTWRAIRAWSAKSPDFRHPVGANQMYNACRYSAQALQHGNRISDLLHLVARHVGFDRLITATAGSPGAVGLHAESL